MKTEHAKVDLTKRTVRIGKIKYRYKLRHQERTWYRISNSYVYVGDDKFSIKELQEAESRGEEPADEWDPVERRVKGSKKLKQLDKILDHALEKEMSRLRRKLKHRHRKLQIRTAVGAQPQDDPTQQDSQRPKRTKWGVRVYSSDGKHFFNLGCWKSSKYPGKASVRLGRYLYTISQHDLEAMLEELRRGLQLENPQKPT